MNNLERSFDMRYEGMIYRPPSEARSLILQLTVGCARNECTFCNMYKDKKFRIRNLDEVVEDIIMAKKHYMFDIERVFLADGDALIVKTKDLLYIIDKIHEILPTVNRITVYGAPKDVLVKKPEELKLLCESGLDMVYMGAESGSDKVLKAVRKNATQAEIIEAGQKLKFAGLKSSITLISGLGGIKDLEEHAVESAKVISAIKPEYASLLTLLIEPGTQLYDQWKAGEFHPLEGPEAVFREMVLFLQNIDSEGTVFRANHASNYIPLAGTFNRDIPNLLTQIDHAVKNQLFRPDAFRQL